MNLINIYEATAARRTIDKDQKSWKFIRDVNSLSQDDLNKTALEDGTRKYSYSEMFRQWERYAAVFSALGMTGANHSRVGVLGSTCAETIFSFYGLNMVGADVSMIAAYSALFPSNIINSIRKENLTDFIITDDFAQVNLVNELILKKSELGLKNIILIHVPVKSVTVEPMLTMTQETKYSQMKRFYGHICMDNLLNTYGNYPISYTSEKNSETAIIMHTSGTTTGAGKPVALSDKALNSAAACFYDLKSLSLPFDNLVTGVIVDLSNAYGIVAQVHLPLAVGASVAVVPWGALNPNFYKAISYYRISFLFTISAMFERWMKLPDTRGMDFSSLAFVVLGGASVSAADKRRYYDFVKAHGAGDILLLNGYGISELGGACCLSTPDLDDESIGYPLPGVNIRLYDDEKKLFLPADEAPSEGVLYLNAPSLATITLDGKEIMKVEYADGVPYICTNDLVRKEEDGRIVFLGRANRYFINEEGRRYESGRVETEFSRQPNIESCCVVPVYIKTTHDNIPMLCVKTLGTAEGSMNIIRRALRNVFITEKTLQPDHIPSRILIAEDLPRNGNGKIDLYKISKGEVEGQVYTVEAIRIGDTITEFTLLPYQEGRADMIKEVFDGISGGLKDNNMPFGQKQEDQKQEGFKMNDFAKTAFDNFNNMNQMGMQMMNNMMGNMGSMNKEGGNMADTSFYGMPNMQGMMPSMQDMMQNMQGMMQNMQGMMPDMQTMMQNMQGMMPGMQNMMPGMQNMMPDMQTMMQNMQGMMPGMQNMMPDMQTMMQNMMPDMQTMMQNMQGMMPGMQTMMPNMQAMMPDMQAMVNNMQKANNEMMEMNRKAADNMLKMRPDMQKMMDDMMKRNKKASEKMQKMTPDMQIMMKVMEDMYKKAMGMMPAAKVVNQNMQDMAQNMGTAMQQQFSQMLQCASQMNKIGFDAMQKNMELNRQLTDQFISGMQQIASTDWVSEGEKFKAEAEKKAKEEKKTEVVKEEVVVEEVKAEDVIVEPVKEKKAKTTRGRKNTKTAKKEVKEAKATKAADVKAETEPADVKNAEEVKEEK